LNRAGAVPENGKWRWGMARKEQTRLPEAVLNEKVKQVVAGFYALYFLQCKFHLPNVREALGRLDPLIDSVVRGTGEDVIDDDVKQFAEHALAKK